MKSFIISAALVLLMSSCASMQATPTKLPEPPQIPADQLIRCDALDVPVAGTVWDLGSLYTAYTGLLGQYSECAIRHDCLIAAAHDPEKNKTCPELDKFKATQNKPFVAVPTEK